MNNALVRQTKSLIKNCDIEELQELKNYLTIELAKKESLIISNNCNNTTKDSEEKRNVDVETILSLNLITFFDNIFNNSNCCNAIIRYISKKEQIHYEKLTVSNLIKCSKEELLGIKRVGVVTIDNIESLLKKYNLYLKDYKEFSNIDSMSVLDILNLTYKDFCKLFIVRYSQYINDGIAKYKRIPHTLVKVFDILTLDQDILNFYGVGQASLNDIMITLKSLNILDNVSAVDLMNLESQREQEKPDIYAINLYTFFSIHTEKFSCNQYFFEACNSIINFMANDLNKKFQEVDLNDLLNIDIETYKYFQKTFQHLLDPIIDMLERYNLSFKCNKKYTYDT